MRIFFAAPLRLYFSADLILENRYFRHLDLRTGTIVRVARRRGDLLDNIDPLSHLAKNRVTLVQMRRGPFRDEKLTAVGIWPRIGHR